MVQPAAVSSGFVITGQDRFLQPWREARDALPGEAATLERLVADNPEQHARAQRINQATSSYLHDYSVPPCGHRTA